jgi:hypothetical protein
MLQSAEGFTSRFWSFKIWSWMIHALFNQKVVSYHLFVQYLSGYITPWVGNFVKKNYVQQDLQDNFGSHHVLKVEATARMFWIGNVYY